jgi:uridine kinase
MQNKPAILFLTGASGMGKTTLLANLRNRLAKPNYFFLHYDSIGISSFQEIIQQARSLERWQEMTTHLWVEKIANEY